MDYPQVEKEHTFCCLGCRIVFNILSIQSPLELSSGRFKESPLFRKAIDAGMISNPKLIEELKAAQPPLQEQEWCKLYFEVGNLWCPSCAEVIQLFLLREKGVRAAVVDYTTDAAYVEYAPRHHSKEDLFSILSSLGYLVHTIEEKEPCKIPLSLYLRFAVASFCALNLMMLAYPLYLEYLGIDTQGHGKLFVWLSALICLPVITYCAWPMVMRFWTGFKARHYGMEALVTMGVATAAALSFYDLFRGGSEVYFDSLSMIVVFVLLGKIIESKAKLSTKEILLRLNRALPKKGRKQSLDGSLKFVPLKEIKAGDSIVVACGERIVLDGVVTCGEAAVDESLMTGESLPLSKVVGSALLAGSIVKSGSLTFKVTRVEEQSLLQQIVALVRQEVQGKSNYVRAADKIVSWFVPAVFFIAFLSAIGVIFFADTAQSEVQMALIRAVSVLLISCPCAIGIAAPLAESLLISRLASMGAIVRNRGCLQYLGREKAIIFDKTGTLTEGKFTLLSKEGLTKEEQKILKGLVSYSNHPIAAGISDSLSVLGAVFEKVEEFAGKGLKGTLNGKAYYLGSAEFLKEHQVFVDEGLSKGALQEDLVTYVYFAEEGSSVLPLFLGDHLRKDAFETISQFRSLWKVLLSGDAAAVTSRAAKECGMDIWYARQTPLQKREVVEQVKKTRGVVMMVGDGINDAPALTAAQIAVSVATATDISIQVSDILLTSERLTVLPFLQEMGRKGRKIIAQNLFWAFFYNGVGVALAAFGFFAPLYAALAMILSSLLVLFNTMRLQRNKDLA